MMTNGHVWKPQTVKSEKIEHFYFLKIDAHGISCCSLLNYSTLFFRERILWPLSLEFHVLVTSNTSVRSQHQYGAEAVVFTNFIAPTPKRNLLSKMSLKRVT